MKTIIQKWGNSLAVRIPKAMAAEASVKQGTNVDISVDVTGKMVIKTVKARYTLKELVDQITPRNGHAEEDWGAARGKELW
jgi:antitoxin MazE